MQITFANSCWQVVAIIWMLINTRSTFFHIWAAALLSARPLPLGHSSFNQLAGVAVGWQLQESSVGPRKDGGKETGSQRFTLELGDGWGQEATGTATGASRVAAP